MCIVWVGLDMWFGWGGEQENLQNCGRETGNRPLGRPIRRWRTSWWGGLLGSEVDVPTHGFGTGGVKLSDSGTTR